MTKITLKYEVKVLWNLGTDKRISFGFVHYLSILHTYTCLVKPMFDACFLLVEMDVDVIMHNFYWSRASRT